MSIEGAADLERLVELDDAAMQARPVFQQALAPDGDPLPPPSSTIAAARKSSGGGHATGVAGSAAPVSRAVSNDILHFPA